MPSADELLAGGTAVVVDRVLSAWTGRKAPGPIRLLRAGASGAAAALLVDLLRPLVSGSRDLPTIDRGTVDRMLAGAGQGLVYGSIEIRRVMNGTDVRYRASFRGEVIGWSTSLKLACEKVHQAFLRSHGPGGGPAADWGERGRSSWSTSA